MVGRVVVAEYRFCKGVGGFVCVCKDLSWGLYMSPFWMLLTDFGGCIFWGCSKSGKWGFCFVLEDVSVAINTLSACKEASFL